MNRTEKPIALVVGGPNGAGKSTLIGRILQVAPQPYLSADAIAFELCPEHPESVAFAAGREFLARLDTQIQAHTDFVVETTLSGRSFRTAIARLNAEGYQTEIAFVVLDSPDLAIRRVAERVRQGGHHVPDADVRRRFGRAQANFWHLYRPLVDRWTLYYNGIGGPKHVAISDPDETIVIDSVRFTRFMQDLGLLEGES